MKTDETVNSGKSSICSRSDHALLYATGEMSEPEHADFEKHMRQCESCRVTTGELVDIVAGLEKLAHETEQPARDVTSAVLARIPDRAWKQQPEQQPVIAWPVLLRAAAVIALLLTCGMFVLERFPLRRDLPETPRAAASVRHAARKPEAIKGALDWLVSVQDASGAWDPAAWGGKPEFKVALTSLAVLGLVEEETPSAHAGHSEAVQLGTSFICSQQTGDGGFGVESEGRMYNHGIAEVALLKAYAATGNEALKKPITDGLVFIRNRQLADGGWGYGSHPTEQANTSISVWQLQALLTARDMGFPVEQNDLDKGFNWLVTVVDPKGYFGYQAPLDSTEDADTLTAMGAYCLFTSNRNGPGSEALRMTIRSALRDAALRAEENLDFYRWYFLANALNAETRSDFAPILSRLQESLVARREQSESNRGSWAPEDRWGSIGGRIYSTSMATLCLAVDDESTPAL